MKHKQLIIGQSKEEAIQFIEALTSEIIEGEVENPILLQGVMHTLKKGLEELLKLNIENLPSMKNHEAYGYRFTQKEAGVKYDFSNCNYPEYDILVERKKQIEEKMKKIEGTLKSLTNPLEVINDKTGEVMAVNPPIRKSTTIIEIR